jgi:putative alpha-1,2-mannosidase
MGLSHGSTLPLVATPWGMTNWAPQTNGGWGWWFQYAAKQVRGIRATRQPSPWMGDYGQFMLMPQTGPVVVGREERRSPYDRDASTFHPDYLKLDLPRYHVTTELTASDRCGVLRLTFADGDTGRLIVDPFGAAHVEASDNRTVRGYSTAAEGNTPPNFKASAGAG